MRTFPVVIRLAESGDAEILAEVITAAFAQYRGCLVPKSGALSETPGSIAQALASGGGFLAEQEGHAIGAALFRISDGALYLGRLAVLPEARNGGTATALLGAIEAEAMRRGIGAISLNVRIALPDNARFFRSRGFHEAGRLAHPGFAEPTFIRMLKPLHP